jgi:hypothetical protein
MTKFTSATLAAALCAALLGAGAPAAAVDLQGQKLDSGLGQLPPYRLWDDPSGRQPMRHRVAGESLDSGLGELPHYREWDDPSGRHPLRHRVLGESLDNGLGNLPPYSQWLDPTGRDPMGKRPTVAQR